MGSGHRQRGNARYDPRGGRDRSDVGPDSVQKLTDGEVGRLRRGGADHEDILEVEGGGENRVYSR